MDANANLAEIRSKLNRIMAAQVDGELDAQVFAAGDYHRLAELVAALDEWISKGGYLPDDWVDEPGIPQRRNDEALPEV